jgi:hypothetical protein
MSCRAKTAFGMSSNRGDDRFRSKPDGGVLFNAWAQMIPIARHQMPDYRVLPDRENGAPLIEAAIKALVIGGLVAAGVSVLQDLVESVDRELNNKSTGSRSNRRPRSSPA